MADERKEDGRPYGRGAEGFSADEIDEDYSLLHRALKTHREGDTGSESVPNPPRDDAEDTADDGPTTP